MEYVIHQKIKDRIENETRDIALKTSRGMGLSTLLQNLNKIPGVQSIKIENSVLISLWENEYKKRKSGKRFVIHAATIKAIMQSNLSDITCIEEELFNTNLIKFIKEHSNYINTNIQILVVIDNFDDLPNDLTLVICNELKSLNDRKSLNEYNLIKNIRFIIGGSIDFSEIYAGSYTPGVSPATNFYKLRPYEFLLSPSDAISLLYDIQPEVIKYPSITKLIVEWSGGHLHYLSEFSKWAINNLKDIGKPSIPELMACLKLAIEDQDNIPIFKYCYPAWDEIKNNKLLLRCLQKAISVGFLQEINDAVSTLRKLPFFIEKPGRRGTYFPINKLVDLFLRQRLSELGYCMPIDSSAVWIVPSLNCEAYLLILEVENRLRNYIGDIFYNKYHKDWVNLALNVSNSAGKNIMDNASERMESDKGSIFSVNGNIDPLLSYIDFGDIGFIVQQHKKAFPENFYEKLPGFLEELNYYRRKIAHNRLITEEQIDSLESRWQIIQRLMFPVFIS